LTKWTNSPPTKKYSPAW